MPVLSTVVLKMGNLLDPVYQTANILL